MSRHVLIEPRRRWPLVAGGAAVVLILAAVGWFTMRPAAAPSAAVPSGPAPSGPAPSGVVPSGPPGPAAAPPPSGTAAGTGQLGSWSLFVERSGLAVDQVRTFEAEGRKAEASAVRRIAEQPTATWFADDVATGGRAARLVADASGAGQVPVLSAYFIPGRDCGGGYSAGGAKDAAAYRAWVGALAAGLAGHRAIVVLEPDAVAQAVDGCLNPARTTERYALLAEAVATLRKSPGVRVYLDAGNPSWITDPARMAEALRRAGIGRAHGFALNVANFETTAANIAYGTALAKALGGARFVVDTSRNGNGPAQVGAGDRHWCNPPGRSLGEPPTTRTGHPLVDAYLWVKRPGESDGACTDDAPPAGQWYPAYALALAGWTP